MAVPTYDLVMGAATATVAQIWACESDDGVRAYRDAWLARRAKYAADKNLAAAVDLIVEACAARLGEEEA